MARKRTPLLIVLTVALLLGVVLLALSPPEPVLPGGAKRIASTVAWQSNRPSAPRATYFWLSPHELLFFDVTTPGLQPVRLDTRTGARVPVRVARNTVTLVPRDWATMCLSPGNRFLLWVDRTRHPIQPVALDLKTPGRTIRWAQTGYFTNPRWLPDGRRWVEISRTKKGPRILVFSVDRPGGVRQVPLPLALGSGHHAHAVITRIWPVSTTRGAPLFAWATCGDRARRPSRWCQLYPGRRIVAAARALKRGQQQ